MKEIDRPNPQNVNPYDSKAIKRIKWYSMKKRYERISKANWFLRAYKNRPIS